ncbi:phosphohydrolase [Fusobacterium sp. PH5-44]|uniref:phosphohydrolase n=1 Tax=unclassified Fusobacterium TaxID=2648384 RepID=UPI003D1C1824
MIIARLKQTYTYFFVKYNNQNNKIVKDVLTPEEYFFFEQMSNYDKVHCFKLYKLVAKNSILKDDINYLKAALLHDSAKEHASYWERCKQVVIKKSILSDHAEKAYQHLKDVNRPVALICRIHHEDSDNIKMKEFQRLDSL